MRYIATRADLLGTVSHLRKHTNFYVDTEFDSSRQGTRLSLVQVSTGEETYVIDALALGILSPLAEAMCAPQARWVMHAGLQDVTLLEAALGGCPAELADTQIEWAFLGPEWGVSLAFLQYTLLGLRTTKAFQADDWLRRPLPEEQLEYAADDVAHLPALQARLERLAEQRQRGHWLGAVSREFLRPEAPIAVPLSLSSFRNAWQLDGRGLSALTALVDWYNRLPADAQELVGSRVLLPVAARMPTTLRELESIKGMSRRAFGDHGAAILSLLRSAVAGPATDMAPPPYARFPDLLAEARLNLLRVQVCAEVSMAPDLALPASLMKRLTALATQGRSLETVGQSLKGWRAELLSGVWQKHARALEQLAVPGLETPG